MARTPAGGMSLNAMSPDRRFFAVSAAAIVVFVFAGFARSFYLHDLFGVPAPSLFLDLHGSVMSGWVLLLFIQAALVSAKRVRWHRRIGFFGACYAVLIVVLGCMATLGAAAREVRAHSADVGSQLNVLALELTQMALFASLVGAAVLLRNRHDWHKRLMLLATLCILPNVIVRLAFMTSIEMLHQNITLLTLWALLVVVVAGVDSYRHRSVHPAFGIVGSAAVASLYAAHAVGVSSSWVRWSTWWVS